MRELEDRAKEASGLYHRLVLLVGPPRSGKTRTLQELSGRMDWPLLNINLGLSQTLLDLTRRQRALRLPRLLDELVGSVARDTVIVDNIELFFAAELSLDPLRLLQSLSRNRTLLVAWPGTFLEATLTYAAPGHPEARTYRTPDALVVPLEEAACSGGSQTKKPSSDTVEEMP